jgi:2-methylcitrate dehydratase PrpD
LFINGISAHVLELDDGERRGQVHLGAPIITSILTSSNNELISRKRILRSILFGYEIGIRLSIAFQPTHTKNGYHATATIGSIAASAATAYLFGLSNDDILNALKISMISGAGFLKVIDSDSNLKPVNVANAAVRGVTSVMLSKSGFVAPKDVLEGDYGYQEVVSKINSINSLILFKSKMFKTIYIKLYPSCRHTHGPIDALKSLKQRTGIKTDEVKELNLYIYDYVINKHDHKEIINSSSAKMSIPYVLAFEMIYGDINIDSFNQRYLNSSDIKKFMSKINVVEKKEYTILLPRVRKSKIEIVFHNNEKIYEEIEYPKGDPENPVTKSELFHKFYNLLRYSGLRDIFITNLFEKIDGLDSDYNSSILNILKVEDSEYEK